MRLFKLRLHIVSLLAVLCLIVSCTIPVKATEISGLDAISVTNGTEDPEAGQITGSHKSSTSNTNASSTTLTLSGDAGILGDAVGTLTFDVKYTLNAAWVLAGTQGSANISATSGISSTSSSGSASITIENWNAGSSWAVTMTASSAKGIVTGHSASTVEVTISNIVFTEYKKESVTFVGVDRPYTVNYYEDATSTSTVSTIVDANSPGVVIDAALTKGMSISSSDHYYCAKAVAVRGDSNVELELIGHTFIPEIGDIITPTLEQDWDKDGIAPFLVNGKNKWTWKSALEAADNSGTIVLNEDYTFTEETYNIPSGVTFLVPYSSSDFTIHSTTKTDSSGGMKSTLKYANTKLVCAGMDGENAVRPKLLLPDVDVTYILTIPSDTTLNVEKGGKFVVGGTIASGNRSTAGISCATAGAHSNVQLEGTLNLNGDMSVCGYILGDGQVNVNSGATVYQPYTAMDFIAGPVVIRCKEDSTFPFYRYAMTNIQSNMRIHSGGNVRGYVSLFTAEIKVFGIGFENQYNVTEFDLISDTGLVRLNSGSTLDLVYDADHYANDTDTNHRDLGMYHRVGKTTMTFTGGMTFGFTSLVVKVQGTDYPVDTKGDHFVIPYNYDIVLNNGTFNVANPLKLLPGANMTVNSDAILQVSNGGSLAIMSGLRDRRVYGAATSDENAWYNEHYPSTDVLRAEPFKGNGSANLILNGGNLQVDSGASFGGLVQTTGTGSVIMNGTNETQVRIGVLREKNEALGHQAGRGLYDLTAQLYARNGNLITLESGKRYTAVDNAPNVVESYSYEYFASCDSDTTTSDTQPLNATVIGTWQCATEEQHSFEKSSTTATCTEAGTATYTCSVCGHSYTEEEAALGHDMVTDSAVPATCTDTGLTEGSHCSRCDGATTAQKVTPALGHTPGEAVEENRVGSTCTADGSYDTVVYCSVCNAELSRETTTIPATGHTEGAVVVENEVAATCTADGSYDSVVYCSVCNAELSRETTTVPATGHTAAEAVVENEVAATCTADGSYDTVVYCSVCDAELSRETTTIPATGHTEGAVVVENEVAATCGADGSYDNVVYCTVCDAELSRETITVSATGEHVYETENDRKAATCTEDGYVVMACACGATETTTVPATGHTEAEAVVENEVAATCTADGSYDTVVYCSVCNAELSRETTTIPATGHTEGTVVVENEVAATCGADGSYDNVVYCTVCDAELSRDTAVVPATGEHDYATETDRKAATCTEDGYVVMSCACGAKETTTLTAAGHTAADAVVENEVAATCTADGSYDTVVYCSVCNAELSRETITVPATSHTAAEAVVENEVAATCTADGSYDTVVYCSVCDAELSRVTTTVPAAGHTDGEVVIENNVDPDCVNTGSYDNVTYCTVCGAETSRETITVEALGHSYNAVVTAPTCEAGGYTTYTCACGDSYVADEVAELGHAWNEGEQTKAPTETEEGEMTYICGTCGGTKTEVIPATPVPHVHSYTEEITKAATCGEEGVKTFTCACGDSYSEEIPATGKHIPGEIVVENIINGTSTTQPQYDSVTVCEICGSESRETVILGKNVFDGMAMNLNDALDLKFLVKYNDVKTGDHYAEVTRVNAKTGAVTRTTVVQKAWVYNSQTTDAIVAEGIAAAQMTDMFYIVLYNKSAEIIGVYKGSIRDYAMKEIMKQEELGANKNDKRVTMFVDMLNYGAAAQSNFSYAVNDLANNQLTEEQQAYATEDITGVDNTTGGEGFYESSLELGGRIQLNFAFYTSVISKDMYAKLTYVNVYGNTVTETIQGSEFKAYYNNSLRMSIGMPVACGGDIVTCTIYDGDTVVTSAQSSVEGYLAEMYNEKPIYPATLKFIKSAYAYFDSLS